MKPHALAWRSLSRQPTRAALGIVGIAAVGALLFDMLLLSRGLVISFRDLLDSVGYDVRVTATEVLPSTGPPITGASKITEAVRALPEVEDAVAIRFGRASVSGTATGFDFIGSGSTIHGVWKVLDGSALPAADPGDGPPSLVINRNLAERLELEPGDALELRAATDGSAALPEVEFVVAGVAEFYFDTADALTAAANLGAYDRAHGAEQRDEVDLLLVKSRPGVDAADTVVSIREAHAELHVFSNEQFISRFQHTDFSYFRQISFVLSTVTLFFAFLLVATLLTVGVNQRFAEIASLRALGFARRRIVADLMWESAFMVAAGGILALPLGGLLAHWLDTILRRIPGLPERLHFFVFQPRAVVLHVVLLAAAGALAAVYPVYLAALLPIAGTLRKETVS
jgi:putative ABC transport system permease protein